MSSIVTSVVTHEGRSVRVTRRRRHSFEVHLLYKQRAANRREDHARETFTSTLDRANLDRYLVDYYAAIEEVRRLRVVRRCVSTLSARRSRHLLSLLELRHGLDAHSVRDYSQLVHQLANGESTTSTEIHVSPLEEHVPTVRPPDEVSLDDVGANAPPVGVCLNSITRRSPT